MRTDETVFSYFTRTTMNSQIQSSRASDLIHNCAFLARLILHTDLPFNPDVPDARLFTLWYEAASADEGMLSFRKSQDRTKLFQPTRTFHENTSSCPVLSTFWYISDSRKPDLPLHPQQFWYHNVGFFFCLSLAICTVSYAKTSRL